MQLTNVQNRVGRFENALADLNSASRERKGTMISALIRRLLAGRNLRRGSKNEPLPEETMPSHSALYRDLPYRGTYRSTARAVRGRTLNQHPERKYPHRRAGHDVEQPRRHLGRQRLRPNLRLHDSGVSRRGCLDKTPTKAAGSVRLAPAAASLMSFVAFLPPLTVKSFSPAPESAVREIASHLVPLPPGCDNVALHQQALRPTWQ